MKNTTQPNVIFLLFILFVFPTIIFAQQTDYTVYYTSINSAERLAVQNKEMQAAKEYDKAFQTAFPFPDDIIDAIKINGKIGNKDEVNKLLKLLVLSGYKKENEISAYIEEDNQYFKYSKETYAGIPTYQTALDSIYEQYRKDYLKNIDPIKDQYVSIFKSYEFLIIYARKLTNDNSEESKAIDLQNILWSSTKDLFLNLYHAGQDISRQHTDSWNDDLFINSLIHSAQTVNYRKDEYQAFLLKMVQLGNLSPYQYAVIIDDVERRLGNPQIYGTLTDAIEFDGDMEKYRNTPKQISAIKEINKVDERRKAIFLPPLWVSAKKYSFKLPENYSF